MNSVGSVICSSRNSCDEASFCMGAQPHEHTDECGRCEFDSSAKCEEVKAVTWKVSPLNSWTIVGMNHSHIEGDKMKQFIKQWRIL